MALKFNRTSAHADIEKIRTAIAALKIEGEWLATSPMPKPDLLEKMAKWVDQLSNKSDSIRRIMNDPDPRDFLQVPTKVDYEGYGRSASLGPLLCELFADQIKDTLTEKIEAMDYEAGPELSERPGLLKQNAAQIKELELTEEELTIEAEKVGMPIERRADLDPAVFLEIDKFPPMPEPQPSEGVLYYQDRQEALNQLDQATNGARLSARRAATVFEVRD